jgi:hypothetical protein
MLINLNLAIPALLFFIILLELLSLSLQIRQNPWRPALSGGQRLAPRTARQLLHDLIRARTEIDSLIGGLR